MQLHTHHIVCVGCNNYDDRYISNLNWAGKDASEIAQAWHHYENTNIDSHNILAGGAFLRPTRANLLACLDGLRNKLSDNDVLWFSFSGHGVVTNDTHRLLLADTYLSRQENSFDLMEQTSIGLPLIKRYLRHSKAGFIVVLLDCCVDVVPGSDRSLAIIDPTRRAKEQGQNVAHIGVLWSKRAIESGQFGHGALTKAWLNTLLSNDRLEQRKYRPVNDYLASLRAKYRTLSNNISGLMPPEATLIFDSARWKVPKLRVKPKDSISTMSKSKSGVFQINYPLPNTDGRLTHYAEGVCGDPSKRKEFTYYAILEDNGLALYCQKGFLIKI